MAISNETKETHDSENERPVLHGYWRSGCSWRLRIILNLKKIDYDYMPVNLLKNEQATESFKELNPAGLVPTLQIDDLVLTETMAVAEYLEDVYKESGLTLIPKNDPKKAYEIRRLCELINSGIQPIQNLSTLNKFTDIGGDK